MTIDQITALAASGESETLEFKATTGKGDWAWLQHTLACLNWFASTWTWAMPGASVRTSRLVGS